MALNLSQILTNFLKQHPEQKFTAREIAEWISKAHPKDCESKLKNSKNKNLLSTSNETDRHNVLLHILVAEIGSQRPTFQRRSPQIKTTEGRPRKFYYTEKSDVAEIDAIENKQQAANSLPREHDLYPLLINYLKTEFGLYARRIDEKRSNNNRGPKGNEWLFPDIVAMEDLTSEWNTEVAECAKHYGDKKAKLWSFEVKRLINSSNVRSAFFQAVSNSSWANFGYLVASELEEKAKKELNMLASLHGIGFILLDTEIPSESQVMIPAREKVDLDWDSINRLSEANTDYADYLDEINTFCLKGKTKMANWD